MKRVLKRPGIAIAISVVIMFIWANTTKEGQEYMSSGDAPSNTAPVSRSAETNSAEPPIDVGSEKTSVDSIMGKYQDIDMAILFDEFADLYQPSGKYSNAFTPDSLFAESYQEEPTYDRLMNAVKDGHFVGYDNASISDVLGYADWSVDEGTGCVRADQSYDEPSVTDSTINYAILFEPGSKSISKIAIKQGDSSVLYDNKTPEGATYIKKFIDYIICRYDSALRNQINF